MTNPPRRSPAGGLTGIASADPAFIDAGLGFGGGGCLPEGIRASTTRARESGAIRRWPSQVRSFGGVVGQEQVLDGRNALDPEAWIAARWIHRAPPRRVSRAGQPQLTGRTPDALTPGCAPPTQ
jgi:hypothetical protein